jgi:hypothetical protein
MNKIGQLLIVESYNFQAEALLLSRKIVGLDIVDQLQLQR